MKTRGFEPVRPEFIKSGSVIMPVRSTKHSAGYDIANNTGDTIIIMPKQVIKWMTNIKAYMQPDEYLEIIPRSSTGIKKNLILMNTVGIIDSDYYSNPDNDGNIGIFLYNYGKHEAVIESGERVCQGIFKKFLIADNCNSDFDRIGGLGSTKEV